MNGKKPNIKTNFIYNALYQLTNILVPFVTTPYLSRALRAEGLGQYSFAYSVAYYFYIFVKLGLQSYGNRTIAYVKDDKKKLSETFSAIYLFQLILGVLMTCIYFIYAIVISPERKLALIFLLIVLAGSIDLTWLLYGLEEFKATSIRDILIKILTAICIFLFVHDTNDVWVYALVYSAGFMISQLVILPLVMSRVKFILPNKADVISHIKPNLLLFLPTIAISIFRTMDKIMLGVMSNSTELGYYHNCENIIKVPMALIVALGIVMLPRTSNMISSGYDDEKIKILFNKAIDFVIFITSLLCFGMMSVTTMFVPLYFGEGFNKCIELFGVILPSCIFLAFANVVRTQYLIPRKMDSIYIISLFAGAIVNVILNFLFIPRLASIGAAIGTTAAEMTVCIVQAAYVFNDADILKNFISCAPFILSGVGMFVIFKDYVPHTGNMLAGLLLKIVICGCFYLLSTMIIFGFKKVLQKKRATGG